jgi:hypothetical protein
MKFRALAVAIMNVTTFSWEVTSCSSVDGKYSVRNYFMVLIYSLVTMFPQLDFELNQFSTVQITSIDFIRARLSISAFPFSIFLGRIFQNPIQV